MMKEEEQFLLHLHGAYRYVMQQCFAIPIIDEISNSRDNQSNNENINQDENEGELDNITDMPENELSAMFSIE